MKRTGFTMIELIFVIVILGILAAVAIPKLSATRTDAKVSTYASDVATALSDMGSYYTAHGEFGTVEEMTNVKFYKRDDSASAVTLDPSNNYVYFNDSADTSCLSFKGGLDGNITIKSESITSSECKGLNLAVANLIKTHSFGGSSVEY